MELLQQKEKYLEKFLGYLASIYSFPIILSRWSQVYDMGKIQNNLQSLRTNAKVLYTSRENNTDTSFLATSRDLVLGFVE